MWGLSESMVIEGAILYEMLMPLDKQHHVIYTKTCTLKVNMSCTLKQPHYVETPQSSFSCLPRDIIYMNIFYNQFT